MSLRDGRRTTIAQMAHVTGTGVFSKQEYALRKNSDKSHPKMVFPGAIRDDNLKIEEGEITMGRRNQRMVPAVTGELAEAGFTSTAGMIHSFHSDEALLRTLYFQGIVTDSSDKSQSGTNAGFPSMVQGYTFARAGSQSMQNDSEYDFYAGDLVMVGIQSMKPTQSWDPKTGRMKTNYPGTTTSKPIFKPIRFDPYDFRLQVDGAFHTMYYPEQTDGANQAYTNPGIANVKLERFLSGLYTGGNDSLDISSLQEEAGGWWYGLASSFGRMLEAAIASGWLTRDDIPDPIVANSDTAAEEAYTAVKALMDKLQVFTPANSAVEGQTRPFLKLVAAVFMDQLQPGSPYVDSLLNGNKRTPKGHPTDPNPREPDQRYAVIAKQPTRFLCGSIMGAWYAKTSRCMGMVMHGSAEGQTLDIMLRYGVPGF